MEKVFAILIEETLSKEVAVRASSLKEALDKVRKAYTEDGEILLDAGDYCDSEILPHPSFKESGYSIPEEDVRYFDCDV